MRFGFHSAAWTLVGLACVAACSSDPVPPGDDLGAGGSSEPNSVPAVLEEVDATSYCVALNEGESLAGVSPEGHAWLLRENAGAQILRVADPFDESLSDEKALQIGTVRQLHPWSATDAAVLAEDGLWQLKDLSRVSIQLPAAAADMDSFCGNFATSGLLVGKGTLYELRDGSWWTFDGLAQASYAPAQLIDVDGNCVANDNYTSVLAKDGSLLQLGPSTYFPSAIFSSEAAVAATNGLVAVLDQQELHIGPNAWQRWIFEGEAPSRIAATGGTLWLRGKEQLLRYDGQDFVSVVKLPPTAGQDMKAHAGGVWLSSANEACHVATAPMIRIGGVSPHQQSIEESYSLTLRSSDPQQVLKATIDGEELSLSDASGSWAAELNLASVGWHELVIEGSDSTRRVALKRLPTVLRSWQSDIQPIYENTCAGGPCHGPASTAAPSLETYDDWVALAATINNRVVLAGTMPPASAQPPDWGDQKLVIAEWLEGGMLP
jgi:hypothetical protein